jgi:hypothetical protein
VGDLGTNYVKFFEHTTPIGVHGIGRICNPVVTDRSEDWSASIILWYQKVGEWFFVYIETKEKIETEVSRCIQPRIAMRCKCLVFQFAGSNGLALHVDKVIGVHALA